MAVALSIIIPSYNRLWALPKAIESCRSATSSKEIIVVDDGSTDGTSDWLASQHDVIHVRTANWGKDWAVNKAFGLAQGNYVRFLDSDDWLEPNANDEQLEIARETDADVVVAGYRTYHEGTGQWVERPWVPCDDFIAQQLGEGESSHYSAFLFKRSFVQDVPHRQEYTPNDDRMFILEVALRHPRLAVYDKFAFVQLHHDRGRLTAPTSIDTTASNIAYLRTYQKVLSMLEARNELTARRRRAPTRAKLWPLAHGIARHDRKAAADLMRLIYDLDPGFEIPGKGLMPTLYRQLGFETTSVLLKLRRFLPQQWRPF